MNRTTLLFSLTAMACTPDYDLTKETEPEPGAELDSGALTSDDTADTVDTVDTADTDPGDTNTVPNDGKPVAVCDVSPNPVEPPFETATWDGSASYDPEGHTITDYAWALVSSPTGSSVRMPTGSSATRGGFMPDLAGEYVGRLTVTTDDGRISDPCEVVLESIPAEDLWVEMFWAVSNDDMDLHLLGPGGSLESNGDCYFANCTRGLSWGASGTTDDPYLDLDDIPGTGPENINIAAPQSGVYTVYVHDYSFSTPDYYGANAVTVRVYINGAKLYDQTKNISDDGSYTAFASIDWSSGTVNPL
jgi:hypothetical protein